MSTHGFGAGDSPLRASGLSDAADYAIEVLRSLRRPHSAECAFLAWKDGRCSCGARDAAASIYKAVAKLTAARVPLPKGAGEPTDGVSLIRAERQRQISSEGWTPEHDDTHAHGEIALAAACYAWPNPRPTAVKRAWPWDRAWWKPAMPGDRIGFPEPHTPEEITTARIKDLRRAGALIAAEIDRLRRAAPDPVHQEQATDGE